MNNSLFFFLSLYTKHEKISFDYFQENYLARGFLSNDANQEFLTYQGILEDADLIEMLEGAGRWYRITELGRDAYKDEVKRRKELEEKEKLEYDLAKITLATNKSVIGTNKTSKANNILSPLFALLAAFISWLGYKNTSNEKQHQQSLELYQKQLIDKDSMLKIQQRQIDSLRTKKAHLDTVSFNKDTKK